MSVFKTRFFEKQVKKESITDRLLVEAIQEMENGLVDADLGGDVYKTKKTQEMTLSTFFITLERRIINAEK